MSINIQINNYKILTVIEGKKIMNNNNLSISDSCSLTRFNEDQLYIFNLPNNQHLIMPNNFNLNLDNKCDICYIINDLNLLTQWINDEEFPEECNNYRVFQKHQEYVLNINKNDQLVKYYLKEKYSINLKNDMEISDVELIYNKIKQNKIYNKDLEFLINANAISLYLKKLYNCKWILIKNRGEYNKYYIPALVDSSGSIYTIFEDLEKITSKKEKMSFQTFNKVYLSNKSNNLKVSELNVYNIKKNIPTIIYLD